MQLVSDQNTLLQAMRLPDVVKTEYETLGEEEWEIITTNLLAALNSIEKFRVQEGAALETDISGNILQITRLLEEIRPFEEERINQIKTRLTDSLESLKFNGSVDENRFEQELIFYLEKLDINEEKVRLLNHCEYFSETLNEPSSQGKKLGSITQEIGREINTIGSKANDKNIQRIVVQMKDYLERVKEQLLNVL